MSKKEKSRLLNYILSSGKVIESYRKLSDKLSIPLSSLHRLIKELVDNKKIVIVIENHVTCFKPYGTHIKKPIESKTSVFQKVLGTVDKLFKKELTEVDWAIINVLEAEAVSKKNGKFADYIIDKVNKALNRIAIKNSMVFRTKHMRRIKRSGVYTRRINSHPEYGYWLAIEEEKHDISFATKKNLSSMKTDIINGTNINLYFDFLNTMKDQYMKIDGQGRLVFHTENDHIKVYSDDKLAK